MRIVLLHILLFLVSITQNLNAQKCGCEGEGVCPVPVDTNSTSQVCYTISNVFLDDLANPSQGICGVSIRFRHGSISKLKVRLRSPNGTSVQLIDGGVGCVPPDPATPVAIWDILFVPQSVTSKPDTINLCPYPKIFNTCPSFCNWQNAAYKGTYYPFFLGKLEDFNSGPVNGQWCLDITNTSMTNGGQIFDFEVIVCDQNGYICCKADAGSLASVKDVNACQGDSTLALKAVPKYGAVVPNSNEYGYTYPIFRNDTLIKYDSLANLRNMPPGNYIVCGLSYLRTDSAKLPAIGSPLTPIAFHNNLNGPSPWLCADIDTNSVNVNIAAIPAPFNMVRTICRGNTIRVGTSAYTSSGTYSTILKSVAGCDSLVNLDLTVLPADTIRTSAILCFGETYIFGADTLSSPGMYSRTLTNSYGCDSTIILNLNILAPIETNLTDTICFGNSRVVGPNSYSTTGVYVDTLKSVFNCDSIVTLDLTVAIVGISIQDTDTLTCRKDSVALKATASAYLGIHSYQWTTTDGVFTGSKTGPTAFAKTQGVYTVTVSSFNCSATASRQVYQDRAPPKASAIANSPDTLTCVNTSVHLSGTGSTGIGPFSFRWTSIPIGLLNDSTNLMPSVSLPGTYRLVLTNFRNGCRDTAGVMVSQTLQLQ